MGEQPIPPSVYEFGEFELDVMQRQLRTQAGRPVALTSRVFETLLYLVEHAGQLVEKAALMEAIWPRVVVEEGSLSQAIYELRRALGERPDEHRFVVTVPGRGYQFVANVVRRERSPSDAPGTPSLDAQQQRRAAQDASSARLPAESAQDPRSDARVSAGTWMERLVRMASRESSRRSLRYVAAVALVAGVAAVWFAAASRPDDRRADRAATARAAVATVAVLPFADLSPQRDQQYFSDGLPEELIHLLARSPSLRVLARTSSFSFRNRTADIATIAGKLGATHIVEGSVRKSGDRVRIAVQLIDGATSSHVWSQTYDRDLMDVFAVQQEIASAIATKLNATLAGDPNAKALPQNAVAYEHFHRARFHFYRRQPGDMALAEQAYLRALEKDRGLARAWVGLAGVYYVSSDHVDMLGLSRGEALAKMHHATEQALALDPNLAEGHARRAMYRTEIGDNRGAREELQHAIALDPNNSLVLSQLAGVALAEGRLEEAVDYQRRNVLVDPLAFLVRQNLGTFLYFAGRFDEAAAELGTVLQLTGPPDPSPASLSSNAALDLAKSLMAQRRFDKALALVASWPEGPYRNQSLALIHHAQGNAGEADAALMRLIASDKTDPHWVAEVYAHRADADEAFRWIAKAVRRSRENGEGLQVWRFDIRFSPFATSLHGDPRWKDWLADRFPAAP